MATAQFLVEISPWESGTSDAPPSVRLRVGKGIRPSLTFESDGSTLPLPASAFADCGEGDRDEGDCSGVRHASDHGQQD